MYDADAVHPRKSIAEKLHAIYGLRGDGVRIDLGFRKPYLDLLAKLGDPHLRLPPCIHVAGTNGKGSVIAFMRAMLEQAGYSVHVYTSPHLMKFNERIILGGQEIPDDKLERYLDEVLDINGDGQVTFFEITTAMAFLAFAREPADILLLETGLGGRLDCTNIIEKPLASVITPISYDHMAFLGDTLEQIAKEKAGIMKSGSKCIIGPQDPSVRNVLKSEAFRYRTETYPQDELWRFESGDTQMHLEFYGVRHTYPRPNLVGPHQIANAATAIMTLKTIDGFDIPDDAMARGIQKAQWPGRLEHMTSGALYAALPAGWELWYDGGHNEAAAKALAAQAAEWQEQDGKPLHLILGMKKDKDVNSFIKPLLPYLATIACADIPGTDFIRHKNFVANLAEAHRPPILPFDNAGNYIKSINAGNSSRILIAGSLYFKNMENIF